MHQRPDFHTMSTVSNNKFTQLEKEIKMNTKKVFPGRASRLQSILLAVVIVTLLFGSLPTSEAAAWTVSSPSGSPGWSSQMQLDIGDITQPYGTHLTVWSSYGPAVRGSPAYAG